MNLYYSSRGWYFPPASPRPKAAVGKERKKFGFTWWGRKWLDLVEEEGDENRMSRGRAYARAEKVRDIKVEVGKVSARVDGNFGVYKVSIKFKQVPKGKWKIALAKIRNSNALAVLLNNELPLNIDKLCRFKVIPEFFESECSCPDFENPCKHIAALYYVLADEIDQAPQILFTLQGLPVEKLQKELLK